MTAPIISIRSSEAVARAVALMLAGDLVILPTDTIYGIGTTMVDASTIHRLSKVRGREPEPALPFLISSVAEMLRIAQPGVAALRLARRFWPGSLTLILPPGADMPAYAKATPIAVRIPAYAALAPILVAVGGHLLMTGAIRSGYPPAITAQEAAALFPDDVALILDGGRAPYGIPSTIVDCIPDPPIIVRRGAIPERKIWRVLDLDESSAADPPDDEAEASMAPEPHARPGEGDIREPHTHIECP